MDTDSDNDSSVIVDQDTSLVGLEQILLAAESDNLTTFESIDGVALFTHFVEKCFRRAYGDHPRTIM